MGSTGRSGAGSKKYKKTKLGGINTITHDDENRNQNIKYGLEMGIGNQMSQFRKNNSQRRP